MADTTIYSESGESFGSILYYANGIYVCGVNSTTTYIYKISLDSSNNYTQDDSLNITSSSIANSESPIYSSTLAIGLDPSGNNALYYGISGTNGKSSYGSAGGTNGYIGYTNFSLSSGTNFINTISSGIDWLPIGTGNNTLYYAVGTGNEGTTRTINQVSLGSSASPSIFSTAPMTATAINSNICYYNDYVYTISDVLVSGQPNTNDYYLYDCSYGQSTIGSPIENTDSAYLKSCLTQDISGNIYTNVSDTFYKYAASDGSISEGTSFISTTIGSFSGISIDSSLNFYATKGDKIYYIESNTQSSSDKLSDVSYKSNTAKVSSFGFINKPQGLAKYKGYLYCANSGNNTISKIGSNKKIKCFVTPDSGLDNPQGLAFDTNGNLYCSNYGNGTISKITTSGKVTTFVSGLNKPTGLVFYSGNLYCSNSGNNTISEININTQNVTTIANSSYGLHNPQGLAFDSDGNLYCANYGNNTISAINIFTGEYRIISGLNKPKGIVFESNGNLFCSNDGDNSVVVISPSGEVKEFINKRLNNPSGLIFNESNYLFIANTNSNQVLKSSDPVPLNPEPVISNICFPAKTPVKTDQGIIAIDKIIPEIHTIQNKKIVAITQTISQDKYLVCFEKDSIKTDVPSEKTMISKDHLILNKGKMVEAKELINNKQIYKVKYNGEILYNVLMEKHERMSINNIICETLNPENMVAKITNSISNLNGKQKKEFIKKANNYIVENKHNISKKQFVKTYHQTHIEPIETNRNVFMFKK